MTTISVSSLLCRLLRQAGHDVQLPVDAGLIGRADSVQLTYAVSAGRSLLSANHDHFRELHELVLQTSGVHPGIIIVRYDNDRRRDLTPSGIVRAIDRVVDARLTFVNQFVILNHWR